ncbi:unnamed protein product [Clavelina lepadiformis]|uniref:Aminopeptidase n=1 Tax=Clavelina lepadiformis TaxID=159417 RepID=A0ABP0F7L0_CLALP
MGGFDSIDGRNSSSTKGKVVLSKGAVVAYVIVTIIIIVTVGLLAGLLPKRGEIDCPPVDKPVETTASSGVIVSTGADQTSPSGPTGPWADVRLPKDLVPLHYVVDLQPNLEPVSTDYYVFNGTSSVDFTVKNATSYIIIHSNKLNYSEVIVKEIETGMEQSSSFSTYEPNQFLVVEMSTKLVVGKNYTLSTVFMGELADDLGGLYRSSYTNEAKESIVIATTQMQPTDARKAFPCFDEPAMKATFDIKLWHKDPYFALSNMPNITTEVIDGDWKRTTFDTTPIMSSYLLAFVVCDFDYVQNATSKVQARIYGRPEQIANGNGDYARDITPVILEHFETFFNVAYPLPKTDQIAVPDFAAGAMENWGLVIYRETALLYDSMINSASNKQRVAVVVAHELAHQWFGNLISPAWWDELWLNEGFASYVEYIGTNAVEPTWRMNDQFVVSDLHRAMNVDGLTSSRPIVAENVETPSDINALFDTISYSKGACIIRMINHFVGDDAFKLGLMNYLNEFEYGTVTHKELFQYWGNAVATTPGVENPPVGFSNAMNTWILQMGYPVVNMKRESTTSTNVKLTQERFLLDPNAKLDEPTSPYSYVWDVPFWYLSEDETSKTLLWLNDADVTLTVPAGKYFIGNYEAFGYYRVNYDDKNWQLITDKLNGGFEAIDVKSRAQLIDDAFQLARAKRLDYTIPLRLTEFLRSDFDYLPWESALDAIAYLVRMLGRSKAYGPLSTYMLDLVGPLYNNLTWIDGGSHLEQYQRINAIGTACGYGHPGCVQNATDKFNEWRTTGSNSITPNLRTTVYCNAIANGGSEEWDFAWEKYKNESNSQEKAKLEYSLACTRTPWIIRRFLDYVLDDTYVRRQDASSIFQDLCYNEYARDMTWDFIRQEWDFIYNVYGTGFFSFSGIINSCTSHFSTDFELQQLLGFKDTNGDKLGSGVASVEQAIESTNTNIQWRKDNEEVIFTWLSDQVSSL